MSIGLTVEGYGPAMLADTSVAGRVLLLQDFLTTAVLISLPVASVLARQRKTEAALVRSEELYRTLVVSTRESVFQLDPAGRWIFLNPAWQSLTGHAVENNPGTSFLDYVHPGDRPQCAEQFDRLSRRQVTGYRAEIRYLTGGGSFRWVEASAQVILGEDGQVTAVAGMLVDIDAHKATEIALQAAREQNSSATLRASGEEFASALRRVVAEDAFDFRLGPAGRAEGPAVENRRAGFRREETVGAVVLPQQDTGCTTVDFEDAPIRTVMILSHGRFLVRPSRRISQSGHACNLTGNLQTMGHRDPHVGSPQTCLVAGCILVDHPARRPRTCEDRRCVPRRPASGRRSPRRPAPPAPCRR